MSGFIEFGRELRPCIRIETGEKLLFHNWVCENIALCEREDGTIGKYGWNIIRFLDSKHKEYDFTDHPTEKGGVSE